MEEGRSGLWPGLDSVLWADWMAVASLVSLAGPGRSVRVCVKGGEGGFSMRGNERA